MFPRFMTFAFAKLLGQQVESHSSFDVIIGSDTAAASKRH